MKIHQHNIERLTIVNALGKIIQVGEEGGGVLIVDCQTSKPVLEVSEVSDDETVQVFLHIAPGAAFGKVDFDNPEDTDHYVVESDDVQSTHEILINRADHKELRPAG